jgi:two-component system chemotaxis response regulator CheY
VVDDREEWRALVREALEASGHTVCAEARDGREALSLYARERPDLVTLDINMPQMNGLECLAGLRAADPDARVVMCTSLASPALQAECRALGAAGYVVKPFSPDDLRVAAAEALA